ncbi:MAG: hypothetical protein IT162_15605 [Bryobacterales bacterium]|nr:hypothetical protein [Bryobacterales bacterium]
MLTAALLVMSAAIFGYQYRNATYLLPLLPLLAIAGAASAPIWILDACAVVPWVVLFFGPDYRPHPGRWLYQTAAVYATQEPRTHDLIIVGIEDDFSSSTLPALRGRLRYAIQGAARSEGQITLDFVSMGIVVPAAAFPPDPARFAPKLREWGLNGNAALGTVISWETPEDLAALVRAQPAAGFLFPATITPPPGSSHRHERQPTGETLLVSSLPEPPRAQPATGQ